MAQDVLAVARELAEEVLFPDAMRVDRLDVLPVAHLDALAAAGLYGAPSDWPARQCSCWCSGPGRASRARSCSGSAPWPWPVDNRGGAVPSGRA